ncbi:MAG: pseudouridine synthase [Saccharofermentanales bacterium]
MDKEIRINKYLSEAGYCSRRAADELVAAGLVKIGHRTARAGDKVAEGQKVTVNDKPVLHEKRLVYIAYHKPEGIVCTTDKEVESNIIDALGYPERVFPIGRLDRNSTGLIFLTNDGDIVNKILRAGNNHEKEYIVTVDKPIDEYFISTMSSGVPILGTVTRKCRITPVNNRTFKIVLMQGLNRQIRRMCEYLGYDVIRLHRVRIMNIHIGTLKPGCWREMTVKEKAEINRRISDSSGLPFFESGAASQVPEQKDYMESVQGPGLSDNPDHPNGQGDSDNSFDE